MLRILTTLYNARPYIERCITSIQDQTVREWRCYILNDMSDDGSDEIVARRARDDARIILINHTEKLYQVGAYLNVLSRPEIGDDDVCVAVDGDDWLPDELVFQRVQDAYSADSVWLTWGSMLIFRDNLLQQSKLCRPLSSWDDIRGHPWVTSHLRTWRAFLFRAIDPRDLRDSSGDFWRMSGDQAFMLPMLEMSGPEHSKYLRHNNYIYNAMNPLNDHAIDIATQIRMRECIRMLPPYRRMQRPIQR